LHQHRQRLHIVQIGADHCSGVCPYCIQFIDQRSCCILRAMTVNDDIHATSMQHACGGRADAPGRTRH
jgi:hypothetical protein